MPAPGERLEGDAQAAVAGSFREFSEVGGRSVNPAETVRRYVAADHEQVAAEFSHHVKLALGAGKHTLPVVIRHTLKIAKRLQGQNADPQLVRQAAHLARGTVESDQIALENLHCIEFCGSDGIELLTQCPAQ